MARRTSLTFFLIASTFVFLREDLQAQNWSYTNDAPGVVTLHWSPVPGAADYQVGIYTAYWWTTVGPDPWPDVTSEQVGSADTSITIYGLPLEQPLMYGIRKVNQPGNTNWQAWAPNMSSLFYAGSTTPPANDDVAGAITLPVNTTCQTTGGTFYGATNTLPDLCTGGITTWQDVHYKFTATGPAVTVTVDPSAAVHDLTFSLASVDPNLGPYSDCEWFYYPLGAAVGHTFTGLMAGYEYVLGLHAMHQGLNPDKSFTVCLTNPCVKVVPRIFLDGPFVSATNLMDDGLRAAGLIPLTEPFTAMGYPHVGGGGEIRLPTLTTTGANAIVDWVLVELRDNTTPSTIITTRAALVQRDGDVVDMNGIGPVNIYVPSATYKVAVRHRNHLGVMKSTGSLLSSTSTTVDFTTATTTVYGTNARKTNGTKLTLWPGDTNFNGTVKYAGSANDRDIVLTRIGGTVPTASTAGYYAEDVNLNGTVKYAGSANDRDIILQTIGGTVPTATRVQQLP
ncbi:MAG: hypothetical protein IPK99_11705 [Flavobacteriales bacterium]|nr:hypothetical protein [Flavobacteriales bacterium]